MSIELIAFTDRGMALAERLAAGLGGRAARCGRPESLEAWTARTFAEAEALVFVGAAGIAVRAVATWVKSKAADPAVVAVDETGTYAVALLGGHLGGANDLARRIGALCGAEPVITTATDRNGVFPVDEWARVQGCAVPEPGRIKAVSARLLAGEGVRFCSDWPVAGTPPAGVEPVAAPPCEIRVTLGREDAGALRLVPRVLTLGVGCRRGTAADKLEAFFRELMEGLGLAEQAVRAVCTIDRKTAEPGLAAFCRDRGLPLLAWSAAELAAVEGDFSASGFVRDTVGVDNVCERSAVLGSGGGELICPKTARDGITLALASSAFRPDWRYA